MCVCVCPATNAWGMSKLWCGIVPTLDSKPSLTRSYWYQYRLISSVPCTWPLSSYEDKMQGSYIFHSDSEIRTSWPSTFVLRLFWLSFLMFGKPVSKVILPRKYVKSWTHMRRTPHMRRQVDWIQALLSNLILLFLFIVIFLSPSYCPPTISSHSSP